MIDAHAITRPLSFFRHRRALTGQRAIGGIALGLSILAGSTFNGFAKELSGSLTPLSLIFVSELLILGFILFSFGLFPIVHTMRKLKRKQLQVLLFVALLTGVLGPFLWFLGIANTTAIRAGFFSRTEMIFMILLAHVYLKEPLNRSHYSAIISIFAGVLIITLRGFLESAAVNMGDVIIVLGVICYSIGHLLFRKHLSHVESHLPVFMRSVAAICTFFLLSPFLETPFIDQVRMLPQYLTPALIGFALVSRLLNSITFYEAMDRLPMSIVSVVSSLTIIGSTLFAWLYVGEPLRWYHLAGGAFIILGNILLELLGQKKPDAHVEHRLTQRLPH